MIYCTYTSGTGQSGTPTTLKRRTYWLLHNSTHVLVHYLDEAPLQKVAELLPEEHRSPSLLDALNLESQRYVRRANNPSEHSSVHDTWDTNELNNLFLSDVQQPESGGASLFGHNEVSLELNVPPPVFESPGSVVMDFSVVPKVTEIPEPDYYTGLQMQIKELQGRMRYFP